MPFVPQEMTPDERDLLASVTRQLMQARKPQTPAAVQAARNEAEQVAAEMIWAQRAEACTPDPEDPMDPELQAYYRRLAAAAAENRAMYEDPDEPYSFEIPPEPPQQR